MQAIQFDMPMKCILFAWRRELGVFLVRSLGDFGRWFGSKKIYFVENIQIV